MSPDNSLLNSNHPPTHPPKTHKQTLFSKEEYKAMYMLTNPHRTVSKEDGAAKFQAVWLS